MYAKGESGNPGGRRKERPFRDALMLALTAEDKLKLRTVAQQLVAKAIIGDVAAIKEIADRIDGKVPQAQILTGDEEGGPVRYERIERIVVDPANTANTNSPGVSAVPAARAV